jgi:hypothetical protein
VARASQAAEVGQAVPPAILSFHDLFSIGFSRCPPGSDEKRRRRLKPTLQTEVRATIENLTRFRFCYHLVMAIVALVFGLNRR